MSGIASARAMLQAAAAQDSAALVALSGGKDSIAVLDLACSAFERVEAFFMHLVPGIACIEDHVHRAVRRHNVKLHSVPHWMLSVALREGTYSPELGTKARKRALKIGDVEAAVRARTGIRWIVDGRRMSDSLVRRLILRKNHGVDASGHLSPRWDWSNDQVFAYLRLRKIAVPPRLGTTGSGGTSGLGLDPQSLTWLHKHHPEDFARLAAVFPFAHAAILRSQVYAAPHQASKVRRSTRVAKRHPGSPLAKLPRPSPGSPFCPLP